MAPCVVDIIGLYSAAGQELTVIPEYATLFIAVEPLTTILTSFKRLSAVVCYCVVILCTYVALARKNDNLPTFRG